MVAGTAAIAQADSDPDPAVASIVGVTKPAEATPARTSAHEPEPGCVLPPSVDRVVAETARLAARTERRCGLQPGQQAWATIYVDLAGRVRAPAITSTTAPETSACLVAGMRTWRYSRRAVAPLRGTWEPMRFGLVFSP